MKRVNFVLILLLVAAVIGPLMPAPCGAALYEAGPFALLPNPLTVGVPVYDDMTQGILRGNWGVGASYTILNIDLSGLPWVHLKHLELGWDGVVFRDYEVKSWSANYNLTQHVAGIEFINSVLRIFNPESKVDAIKLGVFAGRHVDDTAWAAGITYQIFVVSFDKN